MINIKESKEKNQTTYRVHIDEFPNISRIFRVTHQVGKPPISVVMSSSRVVDYDVKRDIAERKAYGLALHYAQTERKRLGNWLTVNSLTSFTRPSRRSKLERIQCYDILI